ncbi:Uncharacterized protein Adt_35209 [Abeliophyllum distichum]|uniref:MULE transposase domain-containing protein n=1 Tax=Abeliophyllum distichum TaxID=126358 RepID=A0ABD1QFV8_9LAMI
MIINADDQNVESPAGNSKNTASSYSSGHEVVNDNQFTNEQLLSLSSPITTYVISTDEDVPDDKVFKSKKDLMGVALACNEARSWVVRRHIVLMFLNPSTVYILADVINDVRNDFGVVMSYQKAWKSRECALIDLRGSPEESYAKLASYAYNLSINNPVDLENDASWNWFFTQLKEVTSDQSDLVLKSDRGQSIINGFEDVYPNTYHGHCIYHIKGNLRLKTKKSEVLSLFKKAAEAYTVEECDKYMTQIKNIHKCSWDYLQKAKYECWAR